MKGPDREKLYPNENIKTVCYISNLPKRPNVEIGEIPIIVIIKSLQRNSMTI